MCAKAWLAAVAMAIVGVANAMEGPKVEYSATMNMETADAVIQGPVYYRPGMERREYVQDGESTVMIIRHDKKVVWMLMPSDEMYMETPFSKEGRSDDLSAYHVDAKVVGNETVNGMNATKSKIIMTAPDGGKMGGFWWATKDGIIIKMDAIAVDKAKKSKERFKLELTDLKVGKQDPALFEIPKGYEKMDMGSMGSMMLRGGDDEEDSQDDGDNGDQDKGKEDKKGGVLKGLFDLMK